MTSKKTASAGKAPKVSKEEMIGFHKGALQTLGQERIELIRMIQIVEKLMQAHMKALQELGIDLQAEIKKAIEEAKKQAEKEKKGKK